MLVLGEITHAMAMAKTVFGSLHCNCECRVSWPSHQRVSTRAHILCDLPDHVKETGIMHCFRWTLNVVKETIVILCLVQCN